MTRVVELTDLAAHAALVDLLGRVWAVDPPAHVICPDVVRALAHAGNYVVGAYRGGALAGGALAGGALAGGALAGGAIGFFGVGHLHLHIAAVDPHAQGQGVGYAIMRHVREWALARGLAEVRWTFDPLVRRNAHFNLVKLGARATAYLPRFYSPLPDAASEGDDTDRLYVTWHLDRPSADQVGVGGGAVLLDRAGDRPVRTGMPLAGLARALVAVPPDVESLRLSDPELAAAWRQELRRALTGALAAGFAVAGFTADGRYLLTRPL